jgi:hypothetical protein
MYGSIGPVQTKPSWGRLYALAALMLALLGAVDAWVPAGVWRRTLEVAITVVAFAAIHLWVRGNRRALDLAGERDPGFRRVVEAPARPRLAADKAAIASADRGGTVIVLPRRRSTGS